MGSFIDLISTLLEEVTTFPVDRRNAYIKESIGRLCARNAQIHARLVVCRRVTDVIALGRGRVCRGAAACCPNETNHLSPSSLLPQNAMLQKNGGPEKLLVSYVMRPYPELNGRELFTKPSLAPPTVRCILHERCLSLDRVVLVITRSGGVHGYVTRRHIC